MRVNPAPKQSTYNNLQHTTLNSRNMLRQDVMRQECVMSRLPCAKRSKVFQNLSFHTNVFEKCVQGRQFVTADAAERRGKAGVEGVGRD